MINKILAFSAIVMLCIACSSDPAAPNDDVQFEGKKVLTAKVNGAAISAAILTGTSTEDEGVIRISLLGNGFSGVLTLEARVTGSGTYTLGGGEGSAGSLDFLPPGAGFFDSFDTGDDATVSLTVDRLDHTEKRVRGRFSGKIKDSKGAESEVTEGVFEASW